MQCLMQHERWGQEAGTTGEGSLLDFVINRLQLKKVKSMLPLFAYCKLSSIIKSLLIQLHLHTSPKDDGARWWLLSRE